MTPTREQVCAAVRSTDWRTLKPNDANAFIAKKVFGLTWHEREGDRAGFWQGANDPFPAFLRPEYSTTWKHAGLLAERMERLGFDEWGSAKVAGHCCYLVTFDNNQTEGNGGTFPEALVDAAFKALENAV